MDFDADVIVIGLGCSGLSATYHLSKNGYKVIGLERLANSGAMGSGSFGTTRIWRYIDFEDKYTRMMEQAMKTWREVEAATNQTLLVKKGLLWIVADTAENHKIQKKFGSRVEPAQIAKSYPIL